ncbi:unnamed protein product [Phaedon cochleariae]|uniref:Myb-like domain-containing protein n=1 Tax=Phaedon cochleariae TaxID=80249 RepID=A0A9P0GP39_PHACE|nr:unnamed protein product [Phaedon cochleariae]
MAKVGTNEESVVHNPPSEPKVPFIRRKLIKIPVAVNTISRKPKEKPKQDCQNQENSIPNENNDEKTKDNIVGVSCGGNNKIDDSIEKVPVEDLIEINHNLDETDLTSQNPNSSTPKECVGTDIKKSPVILNSITAHSDTEYPPPPPSPNKINRTRIKAVPRLDYRKASFSASESEDESRKNNRIRNDSVCSTTSAIAESVTECFSPQRPKEVPTAAPKKCIRSEQTRKLAEARREFQRKFGPNKPDRHKLTMMDLIFYNPESNHMLEGDKKIEDNPKEEIDVDDPKTEVIDLSDDTSKNEKENDEESAVPVPQIKIGPSGEIIIDEQSLVIERKEVKKQIEEMAKTKIVDGDFDTGYGIYKKHKRSKKWSEYETIRFYKAINIIGTDFSLMCELFPNRSRRELKMKFKKEENLNKGLMNRAVMHPGDFDFDELKNEVDLEEKEMQEKLKQKEDELKQREADRKLTKQKMARRAEKRKIAEKEKEANFKLNKPPKPKPEPRPPKKMKKFKRARNDSFVEDSDADESDLATHSESDDEIVMPQGPTRSGRMPKSVRKYDDDDEEERLATVESVLSRARAPAAAAPATVEPGSIMIVTETGPNGEPVYKIFMVTPDHNAMPVQLSTDFVSKALELKKGVTAKNIMTISASVTDDETEKPVVENNITIPADENVTTLKSELSESEEKYIVGGPGIGSEVEL